MLPCLTEAALGKTLRQKVNHAEGMVAVVWENAATNEYNAIIRTINQEIVHRAGILSGLGVEIKKNLKDFLIKWDV